MFGKKLSNFVGKLVLRFVDIIKSIFITKQKYFLKPLFFILLPANTLFSYIITNNKAKSSLNIEQTKSFKRFKGCNIFHLDTEKRDKEGKLIWKEVLLAAKKAGFSFIRLPINFNTKQYDSEEYPFQDPDFLANWDDYSGLIEPDLQKLLEVLEFCSEIGLKVVLTTLSLPGSRWIQHNLGKRDLRIWGLDKIDKSEQNNRKEIVKLEPTFEIQEKYFKQSAKFWSDLISAIQKHLKLKEIVIGYNLINEPCPELAVAQLDYTKKLNKKEISIKSGKILHKLYSVLLEEIRKIDLKIKIILDGPDYASPEGFQYFLPLDDPNIVYSFHFYLCYREDKRNKYPGFIYPTKWLNNDSDKPTEWNSEKIREDIQPIVEFQKKYNIPDDRIFVGEIGANRRTKGLKDFFDDFAKVCPIEWQIAIYAFQETKFGGRSGMDYEIPPNISDWMYIKKKKPFKLEDLRNIFR